MDGKEFLHLPQNRVEGSRLKPTGRFDRVAVHRVTAPDHICPVRLHRADKAWQMIANLARTKARDQCQAACLIFWVQLIHQDFQIILGGGWAAFQTNRVLHPCTEFNMRALWLTGAVANPDHMTRACNRFSGGRVNPTQGFLIF